MEFHSHFFLLTLISLVKKYDYQNLADELGCDKHASC